MGYEIRPSARKHGIGDDDILHAIDHAVAIDDYEDDDQILYLGPDRAPNLLEVVTVSIDDELEVVIHAMAMRRQYRPLLRGLGEPHA